MVFSCYLPPESLPCGRDASSFFSHLMTQIYTQHDFWRRFQCAHWEFTWLWQKSWWQTQKLCIDHTQNQHGIYFIEILNDCKVFVLNGRFGVDSNDYTFQSTRGHSVVDYICVPQDIYNQCSNFRVIPCNSRRQTMFTICIFFTIPTKDQ